MTTQLLPALKLAFGAPVWVWWPLSSALFGILVYSFLRQRPLRVVSAPRLVLYTLAPFTLCFVQVVIGCLFEAPDYLARGSRIGTGLVALIFVLSIVGGVLIIRWLAAVRFFAVALVFTQLLFTLSSALIALVLIHHVNIA
jgi:hypothetical protein